MAVGLHFGQAFSMCRALVQAQLSDLKRAENPFECGAFLLHSNGPVLWVWLFQIGIVSSSWQTHTLNSFLSWCIGFRVLLVCRGWVFFCDCHARGVFSIEMNIRWKTPTITFETIIFFTQSRIWIGFTRLQDHHQRNPKHAHKKQFGNNDFGKEDLHQEGLYFRKGRCFPGRLTEKLER